VTRRAHELDAAREELRVTAMFYERQRPGFGDAFLNAVDAAAQQNRGADAVASTPRL